MLLKAMKTHVNESPCSCNPEQLDFGKSDTAILKI